MSTVTRLLRAVVALAIGAVVAVAAWYVFVEYPAGLTELLGITLGLVMVLVGLQLGGRIAGSLFPDYNVAEVAVEGPITRDGGGSPGMPSSPRSPGADDVVEQIERADEDRNVDALVVKLNTPGGQVVPSEDIREAAADFDGPTIGYATDMCASGGMWIASGCDELWAREGSMVGSVGVILSQFRAHDFIEEHGIDYERIVAGDYKDAMTSFKPLEDDEREYLQGITDEFYESFVERVAEGHDMDPEDVRDTEAKIYLGERARELGLVDELGNREAIEDRLEADLNTPIEIEEFEPERGLADRFRGGAQSMAYAFGAGIAARFDGEATGLELR